MRPRRLSLLWSSSEPDPAPEPVEPVVVEFAAVRYERERIDAWIRNRLIAYPLASCFALSKTDRCGAGLAGSFERRRRERVSIAIVTSCGVRARSRGATGAGARGLNLPEAKVATYARCRRCPCGPAPTRRRRWSRIFIGPLWRSPAVAAAQPSQPRKVIYE